MQTQQGKILGDLKEKPLPLGQMKSIIFLYERIWKDDLLKSLHIQKEEGLHGAKIAAECGCDVLLGTLFSDSINQFCQKKPPQIICLLSERSQADHLS